MKEEDRMLNLKVVVDRLDEIRQKLESRGEGIDWERLAELTRARRDLIEQRDRLRQELNQANKKMKGKVSEEQRDALRAISSQAKDADGTLREVEESLSQILLRIPNIPHESVPPGADEESNVEVRRVGQPREFDFPDRKSTRLNSSHYS